jgi:hypothetical protein
MGGHNLGLLKTRLTVLASIAFAACGGGSPTPTLASILTNGGYDDAILLPVCTTAPAPSYCPNYSGPHYSIDVTVTGTDRFTGNVLAWGQDYGSQTILFTFTAAAQSGTASLTVTGLGPADPSSVWISSGSISIGEVLTASYQGGNIRKNWPIGLNGTHVLTLDGCSNYLVLATTRPDCDFALEGRSS